MTTKADVQSAIDQAVAYDTLDEDLAKVIDLDDTVLQGFTGTDIDDIDADEVVLVTLVADVSPSIEYSGLTQAVITGQNVFVNDLADSKFRDEYLIAQWLFECRLDVVHGHVLIADATSFDRSNYDPSTTSGTALYDGYYKSATAHVAKAAAIRATGTSVRNIIVVVTDGFDNSSRKRASDCAALNKKLLASEQYLIGFLGVGSLSDFRPIAQEMGFPDGAIAVAPDTPGGVRKIFNLATRSVISGSKGKIDPNAQNSFFNV